MTCSDCNRDLGIIRLVKADGRVICSRCEIESLQAAAPVQPPRAPKRSKR